jgi:hypothetical protein
MTFLFNIYKYVREEKPQLVDAVFFFVNSLHFFLFLQEASRVNDEPRKHSESRAGRGNKKQKEESPSLSLPSRVWACKMQVSLNLTVFSARDLNFIRFIFSYHIKLQINFYLEKKKKIRRFFLVFFSKPTLTVFILSFFLFSVRCYNLP